MADILSDISQDPDVTLHLLGNYIGSAYSPQVEVTETDTGHEVAITYDDATDGITTKTFSVEDGDDYVLTTDDRNAIAGIVEDDLDPYVEAMQQATTAANTAADNANAAKTAANNAATAANTAASSATSAASAANTAAGSANDAVESIGAVSLRAENAATAATSAAASATSAAGTATSAASAANTAAGSAEESAASAAESAKRASVVATQGLFSLGAYGDGYALYQAID